MGATSWRYYTAWRPDPEEALQALRKEVFARCEYFDPTGPMEDVLRRTAQRFGQDPDSPEVQRQIGVSLRLQEAVETGDLRGLNRAHQGFVRRLRWISWLFGGVSNPRGRNGKPRSIDELLEAAAECGTHSILDIEHVSNRPEFGSAAPMKPSALPRVFGSNEPDHDSVEKNWPDVAERLDRWHARYLTVYRDGKPHEYAFIGCSGD